MSILSTFYGLIDFIVHIDQYLLWIAEQYGNWLYLILFLIIFVETGLVIMPFLPGDSLLFIVGTLAGVAVLDYFIAVPLMLVAAILGDQCNYHIGSILGEKVFSWQSSRWFNKNAFDKAHSFYQKYGGITIFLARFMPFIRTFAPFVGGVAKMQRQRFTIFNVLGAIVWVVGITALGYFFGQIELVRNNLGKIIWGLILLPGLIVIIGYFKDKLITK